jgi:DNA-binding PadR family transcriptional regulator
MSEVAVAKRRKVSNPLGLAVLAWLMTGPMHPYELGRRLQETGMDRSVKFNRGSLYMVIEQLSKAGFVAEQETVRDSQRPERTVYALTDDGRTELYDWMRELVAEPRHEYVQFGVALSLLSVLPPVEAVELLTKRLASLTTETQEIRNTIRTATKGGVGWVFLIEEEYRLAVLEAESAFVTRLMQSLQQPDYVREWQESFGRLP